MAYQFKISDLLLNEFAVVKEIAEGNSELVSLYSSYVPRLVNRLERYFIMINRKDNMLEDICTVLDKYSLVYSKSVVVDTLEKSKDHDFKPLRQIDCEVHIYKGEVEQIKKLQKYGARQLAFALLVISKLRNIRYADPTIHLYNIIDIDRLVAKAKSKEEVYSDLHEIVNSGMVTVPLIEDRLTINFTQYEGEGAYELKNEDIFNLKKLFSDLVGEYRAESQKTVLEISLVEDYHEVHNSIAETVEKHNKRYKKKVDKQNVSRCLQLERMSAGDSVFIEIDFEDKEDTEYIARICSFVRYEMKKHFRRGKVVGYNWVISKERMEAVYNGQIVVHEGMESRKVRK
ncbi:MAG: hypothetical protein [Malazfec virus 1]